MVDQRAELVRHKQAPLKVFVFAWRLLHGRLPSRSNLLDRGVITGGVAGCLAGCAHLATSQHFILSCGFYGSLWQAGRSWLEVWDRTLTTFYITFIISFIQLAVYVQGAHFCCLFGFFVLGLFGIIAIIDCLIM